MDYRVLDRILKDQLVFDHTDIVYEKFFLDDTNYFEVDPERYHVLVLKNNQYKEGKYLVEENKFNFTEWNTLPVEKDNLIDWMNSQLEGDKKGIFYYWDVV